MLSPRYHISDEYNEEDILLVSLYLQAHRALTYSQGAFLSCLLFNIIETFHLEVERIWKRKLCLQTALFYLLRYFPPLCLAFGIWGSQSYKVGDSGTACRVWWWFEGIACILVVQSLAVALMLVKIWALYLFSRRVLVFLGILYVGQLVLGLWGGITITRSIMLLPELETVPVPGCTIAPPSQTEGIKISWSVLASTKTYNHLTRRCSAYNMVTSDVLPWERTAYLTTLTVAELFLLITLFMDESLLPFVAMPFIKIAYSIPATNMVLNLRDPVQTPHNQDEEELAYAMSLIAFAPRCSADFDSLPGDSHVLEFVHIHKGCEHPDPESIEPSTV